MLPASCALLWLTVVASHREIFTYVKPWDPFRRYAIECETCYETDCVVTNEPRCDYYAETSKLIVDDDDKDDDKTGNDDIDDDKIDTMLFELGDSASSMSNSKSCVPFISQYTDCTEENICLGCKFCTCDEFGKWICVKKQKCRPEPKMSVDHRIISIVIENLKRKENFRTKKVKRSADTVDTSNKTEASYANLSNWMYEVEPFRYEHKNTGIGDILDYLKGDGTTVGEDHDDAQGPSLRTDTSGFISTTDTATDTSDNYVDLLEFNDILRSFTTDELNTEKSSKINTSQTFIKNNSKEFIVNDFDYAEYDPIRLVKRDTSNEKTNGNDTILQASTTSNSTYEVILSDALQGLNKITIEKQVELKELLNIQNNLLNIAKTHNIEIDLNNNSNSGDNYNRHHIAIYKLDPFEKCVAKVKQDMYSAIENVIKTNTMKNASNLQHDLKLILSTIRKYVFCEDNKNLDTETCKISSQERKENLHKSNEPNETFKVSSPITALINIFSEINIATANPLQTLSQNVRKILRRVIKQLYMDDFAIIDFIVHETYYDFDSFLEKIGTKWNKIMQDIVDSDVSDTLYRIKLLYITLRADTIKIEDMITLLDFARNRRMTIANGVTIDKSIARIQDNLKIIDNNVQQIMQLDKDKRMSQSFVFEKNKPAKKKSILQKLKKIFQSSKNDIKNMLRKRFPKSEIMKQIAKKKIDELERHKMMEYQQTVNRWQDDLNVVSRREKRSSWGFKAFADRIKSIIPGYLKGKVKPVMQKKTKHHKMQTTKTNERKKKTHTKPTTIKTTVSRISIETT